MSTLLDTNILTRLVQSAHPQRLSALNAVNKLRQQGELLCIVPQNLYEFWVVCTRPAAQNGLAMTTAHTALEISQIKTQFTLINDTPSILAEWELLVTQHQVRGKNAHDARLVAAMLAHGIQQILTFNASDFQRYPGIRVLVP